jgi:hypothetical protein
VTRKSGGSISASASRSEAGIPNSLYLNGFFLGRPAILKLSMKRAARPGGLFRGRRCDELSGWIDEGGANCAAY